MKKKLVLIVGLSVGVMLLSGCVRNQPNVPEAPDVPPIDEPAIEEPIVEEEPVEVDEEKRIAPLMYSDFKYENGLLSYSLINQSEKGMYYGMEFSIYKLNGRLQWEDTELTKDMAWIAIAMELIPGEKIEDALDVSPFNLSTGTYRIVRFYTQDEVKYSGAIEFSVDETGVFDYFTASVEDATE